MLRVAAIKVSDKMQCLVRLELASVGGDQGPAGGRLRVFTAAGKLAASSTSPSNQDSLQYNAEHKAWIWTASSQWSLLFPAKDACTRFEGEAFIPDKAVCHAISLHENAVSHMAYDLT